MTRSTVSQVRSANYKLARMLGDYQALASGDPKRVAKRFANKLIGRQLSRVWFR